MLLTNFVGVIISVTLSVLPRRSDYIFIQLFPRKELDARRVVSTGFSKCHKTSLGVLLFYKRLFT